MKLYINLIAIVFILGFGFQNSMAQGFKLDPEKSQISWRGSAAFSSYSLGGSLDAIDGTLTIQDSIIVATEVRIDMRSLEAENKDLERHLKSKDFFETNKYHRAEFTLSGPAAIEGGNILGKGVFTIKEIGKDENLILKINRTETGWKVSGKLVFDRTKYGIFYNSPDFFENLKQEAISNEFEIELELFFTALK